MLVDSCSVRTSTVSRVFVCPVYTICQQVMVIPQQRYRRRQQSPSLPWSVRQQQQPPPHSNAVGTEVEGDDNDDDDDDEKENTHSSFSVIFSSCGKWCDCIRHLRHRYLRRRYQSEERNVGGTFIYIIYKNTNKCDTQIPHSLV